ncbi:hypothetical protein BD626DRAFT_417971, partial [Schizophyllum amplum]
RSAHHAFTTFAHSEVLEACALCLSPRKTRQACRAGSLSFQHVGLRTTRSGTTYGRYYTVNNPEFDLDALLKSRCDEDDEQDEDDLVGAECVDDDSEVAGEPRCDTSSPLSSIPSSPAASRPPSPAAQPAKRHRHSRPGPHSTAPATHKASKKRNSRRSRRTQAQNRVPEMDWTPRRSGVLRNARHIAEAQFERVDLDWDDQEVTSTGFTAKRSGGEEKLYALDDLIGPKAKVPGMKLIDWDGSETIGLCAQDGRTFGVLAGHPDDPNWDSVHESLASEIAARGARTSFPKASREHRRGRFGAEAHGVSHGGGQTAPGVLKHTKGMAATLAYLVGLTAMVRIAHFSSSVFYNWAPKLWTYYAEHMHSLFKNDPTLKRNFPYSVWACITINFGPRTVTFKHRDFGNLPFGWCAITALGKYDANRGGHLVLWECGLVIRFPPGSTIIIPSGIIHHSNTKIARRETRYSVTQYTSGALFRWVEHGCMLDEEYYNSLSPSEYDKAVEKNTRRWMEGARLWSTVSELQDVASERVDVLG